MLLKIIIAKDYDQISREASLLIAEEIQKKPDLVLGLATGSTPLGTYKELIRLYREKKLDFSRVKTFNLDEYYGLSPDSKQSYAYYMKENFFKHINILTANTHIPDGKAGNIDEECKHYDRMIEEHGGIDLQILGIGSSGHIGFNEPEKELDINTHLVELSKKTISDNSRFFNSKEEVPTHAITMGLGSIMRAKKILLLVYGANKAGIIPQIINGRFTTEVPASILQIHADTTVIIDEELVNNIEDKRLLNLPV